MEIDKLITFSAIGIAGLVLLIFLLDLTAGIFGRFVVMDVLFILGGISSLAGDRDDLGTPLMRR